MTNHQGTLAQPAVASLLARLFGESERSDRELREMLGQITPEERTRWMTDPQVDYRKLYGNVKQHYMAVSSETARLLYMLARANRARGVVEFGTSFGISTIHLAAAVRDNGGGQVIGSELEPGKVEQARANLREAGLADLVDVREGDALQTLAHDLPETIDLVLLAGHKALYLPIFELVAPRLRSGSLIVADNVDASPQLVARMRAANSGFVSVPFGDDVEVSLKV